MIKLNDFEREIDEFTVEFMQFVEEKDISMPIVIASMVRVFVAFNLINDVSISEFEDGLNRLLKDYKRRKMESENWNISHEETN